MEGGREEAKKGEREGGERERERRNCEQYGGVEGSECEKNEICK